MCASRPPQAPMPARRQRGVSLIESMVGIVVALLIGIAATGGAAMFTASQRQAIAAGGSLLNAGTALAALRDDVAAAGLGFFGDARFLCDRLNLSIGTSVLQDNAAFVPVRITAEATHDRLDAVYATQITSGANVLLASASSGASAELRSLLPATAGQAVLLAPDTPGTACLVRSVTAVTASTPEAPQALSFANSGTHNQATFSVAPSFPDRGRVTLLGELRWSRYRVEGTDLRLERPMGGAPVVLARNVVAFRVQYGIAAAAAGSTALEAWQDASGSFATLDASTLPRVRALRIGVVTRSPQPEKPNAAGQCEASTEMPQLFGQAVTADVSNWRCFRYRSSVTVVPLRNVVMGLRV